MAFQEKHYRVNEPSEWTCLSTDTKDTPSTNGRISIGDIAKETDTGDEYEYKGSTAGWVQTESSGSTLTETTSGSVDAYGNHPEYQYTPATSTAPNASDNTAHTSVDDQGLFAGVLFNPTTGNVTVQISIDGTTFISADHPFIDMGVPARTIVTGTNTNTGPFLLNTPCKAFRFLNEGAVQSVVSYAQVGQVNV